MTDSIVEEKTSLQVSMNRNPTGKGGFQDHPESINRDGKPKSAKRIIDSLLSKMDDDAINEMNEDIVKRARKGDRDAQKFIYDRLAGTPKQSIDITTNEEPLSGFVLIKPKDDSPDGSNTKTI